MTSQEMFDALSVPFPTQFIRWRVGSTNSDKSRGLPLCYVDARAVEDRLDSVCGMAGWQCNYTPASNLMICNLGVLCPENSWVWKSNGAGATDFEGEKGMLSDAFKRAATKFGVGRYLYDLKCDWVALEDKKLSKETLKELNLHHDEKVQEWGWDIGFRPGAYTFRLIQSTIKHFVTDPAQVAEYRESNAGTIASLPVRMRQRINEQLDQVGAAQ
jgi:hypothetical protein